MISVPNKAISVSRSALCLITANWSSFIGTAPVSCTVGTELLGQLQVGGRPVNAVGRLAARLQRGIIQHRLHFNEVTQLGRLRRRALHQRLPRECRRLAGEHVTQGFFGKREWPHKLVELDLSAVNTVSRKRKRFHGTAQSWIGGQSADQKVGSRQASHRSLDIGQGLEQQAILLKKLPAIRLNDRPEQVRVPGEFRFQRVGRLLGVFWCRRRHDDQDILLRKGLGKISLALAPGQIVCDQIFRIRRDRETRDVIGGRGRREQYSQDKDAPGVTCTKIHNSDDC